MSQHAAVDDDPTPQSNQPGAYAAPGAMPGWHIVADLTPPELVASRKVRRVAAWVVIAVVIVAACTGGGYYLARGSANDAASAVAAEQQITEQLRAQQASYASVTKLQGQIEQAHARLATLMASDVDVDTLLANIWRALPNGMTIDQIAVTVPESSSGSDHANSSNAGVGALDTSDHAHIGTVTLSGIGTDIDSVSTFVDHLGKVPGVFDPYPMTNQLASDGTNAGHTTTSYSVQFALTDVLLTHRFDAKDDG